MPQPDQHDHVPYAAWGELFFAAAVTEERVLAGVNVLGGRPIDVGPIGVGPGRVAKVSAKGQIGTATGQRVGDLPIVFKVNLPVTVQFVIDLGVDKHLFDASIQVPLTITAEGRRDLAIELVVTPPTPGQIIVHLKAKGLRASLMQKAAGVDAELRRFVAKYVAREIDKPEVAAARLIDVYSAIDRAAGSLVPSDASRLAAEVSESLPAAFESEIEAAADQLLQDES
ncbi:hypothetical protein [Nocardioides montaniterrae]